MLFPALRLLLLAGTPANVQEDALLWSIGTRDGKAAEFGLAPGGYARYAGDPLYLVGTSRDRDWPYVLPGPSDRWAKGGAHEGGIVFGLAGVAPGRGGRLTIDWSDTHPYTPPRLQLLVNGKRLAGWPAPPGAGDGVILGRAETGKASRWTVGIPSEFLRNGNNTISIANVGGSWAVYDALRFEGPRPLRIVPVQRQLSVSSLPQRQAILRTPNGPRQPVLFEVTNIGPPTKAGLSLDGGAPQTVTLRSGRQQFELNVAPLRAAREVSIGVAAGTLKVTRKQNLGPVRPWTIYLFPHSHVDIGYTDLQTFIEALHKRNLTDAIAVAKESASNPSDSKFRFNVEATWVLDRYLQEATPEQRATVVRALREKTLAVSGGYANLLTGIMHPEELMQSFRYARILGKELGIEFDTVSQTDVPGVTWGNLVALNEAGVKHLVLMPNAGDRIGGVRRAWEDKPFYWVSPSGRERILVWQTDPYSFGVGAGWDGDRTKIYRSDDPSARFIGDALFPKLNRLVERDYPYDIVGEPWSFIDNAPIDADVPKAAKAWNEKYVSPRVVLSTLGDACRELTRRYGEKIPEVKGDYTPYWEDGAGSSAAETALNRATSNRLLQAEALFAINDADAYPAEDFLEAWRNVLLYSEHTWGADISVSNPDDPGVRAQWEIKQGFAREADRQSRDLLARGLAAPESGVLEVRNTTSWMRTDLVRLPAALSKEGDRVEDEAGGPLPSQRLKTGELAVLVRDVPSLGSKRLRVTSGAAYVQARAAAEGDALRSQDYEVVLDPKTGAIGSLRNLPGGKEMVATNGPHRPNQFLVLPGNDAKNLLTNGTPRIEVIEPGPLVATIRVTSEAPGTKGLRQEITLVAGLDRVELSNTLDKLPVRAKEGVHFAFPFAVPEGQVRIDMPWSLVRPEIDQIAGANKNWFTTQGYVDVSNAEFGITWTSLDAPLVEVGELSANLLGSVGNPDEWRQHVELTQTFYSWALNNHWHTNYRADQAGLLTFRYVLQAHGPFRSDAASRLAIGMRQPLLVTRTSTHTESLLTVDDPSVIVTRVSPSDDGKALIVRLWGATPETKQVMLRWRADLGVATKTDLSQTPGRKLGSTVEVPGWGVLTIRIERKRPIPTLSPDAVQTLSVSSAPLTKRP